MWFLPTSLPQRLSLNLVQTCNTRSGEWRQQSVVILRMHPKDTRSHCLNVVYLWVRADVSDFLSTSLTTSKVLSPVKFKRAGQQMFQIRATHAHAFLPSVFGAGESRSSFSLQVYGSSYKCSSGSTKFNVLLVRNLNKLVHDQWLPSWQTYLWFPSWLSHRSDLTLHGVVTLLGLYLLRGKLNCLLNLSDSVFVPLQGSLMTSARGSCWKSCIPSCVEENFLMSHPLVRRGARSLSSW